MIINGYHRFFFVRLALLIELLNFEKLLFHSNRRVGDPSPSIPSRTHPANAIPRFRNGLEWNNYER